MNFGSFFSKIKQKINEANNLNDLTIWKKKQTVNNSGLSFKTKDGVLAERNYINKD
ncbi:hypothetical protein KIT90_27260 [Vibrio sp. B172a]|uniref:hypothetical protein n=1 Tax=Vibrio sp. B172a TaxID=2835790 RepID=UPI0025554590|nr:hypothetical protein [Vibrio sp. B172a]MDK9785091.1 hypothetical protein [Vibrio sp. B172a]